MLLLCSILLMLNASSPFVDCESLLKCEMQFIMCIYVVDVETVHEDVILTIASIVEHHWLKLAGVN